MILSLDLNPVLTREFEMDEFTRAKENISIRNNVYALGSGVKASKLIGSLNEEVKLLTLLGGENGKLINDLLSNNILKLHKIPIKDNNQEQILIKEKKRETIVKSKHPRVTREELDDLLSSYKEFLKDAEVVCLTDSDTLNINREIYEKIIKLTTNNKKKSCVNLPDYPLEKLIEQSPYLLIVTKDQLEKYSNLNLNFTSEVIKVSEDILNKGVGIVVIINNEKGAVIVSNENNYTMDFGEFKEDIKNFDMDLVAGGLSLGISRDYDIETTLKLGMACGVSQNISEIDMAEVKKIMKEITLKQTNRRIL